MLANFPSNSSFPLEPFLHHFNYLKRRIMKSTLSVPWWPAVSSLSETLLRDTALIGSKGVQNSLWLTIHGLGDKKNPFLFQSIS